VDATDNVHLVRKENIAHVFISEEEKEYACWCELDDGGMIYMRLKEAQELEKELG